MFGRFGVWEIIVIVLLIVILFGHNKIPGMMKNLADGLKIFKKEMKTEAKPEPASINKTEVKKPVVKKKATAKKPVAKKK